MVAYRVLQEMLTNAHPARAARRADHGRAALADGVGRELVIEVRNATDAPAGGRPGEVAGSGLDGMRRRLESVGRPPRGRPRSRRGDLHRDRVVPVRAARR